MDYTQEQLEEILNPLSVGGNFRGVIRGIASLEMAEEGDLSFLHNPKYRNLVGKSRASLVLLPENFFGQPPENVAYFLMKNPSQALAKLCELWEQSWEEKFEPGIHPSAVVAPSAKIHGTAHVGAYCVIGEGVSIGQNSVVESHCSIGQRCFLGENVRIHPHVTLYRDSKIGNHVILHSGSIIGGDGYGYVTEKGIHHKIAHIGETVVEDWVEIGANATVDRARFAQTRIGRGTKIDNLVQIGHNVQVGENCLIVAQVGIAGSTKLGNWVVLGGQVGLAGHLSIGSETQVAAQGGVASDLPPKSVVRGTPAMPLAQANRFYVLRKRIPELFRRVAALEDKMKEKNLTAYTL